jgi:DNA-binding NarL/FixJ family response regulator
MNRIKVVLADDHEIFRDGIKSVLSEDNSIEIVSEVSDGLALVDYIKENDIDIAIVDITMPNLSGIEATKIITQNYNCTKVLILSMHTSQDFVLNSIMAGAKGYLPKDACGTDLIKAIHTIQEGKEYYHGDISNTIIQGFIHQAKEKELKQEKENSFKKACFTKRELEIITLFAEGLTNKEISDKLNISIRTVDSHKSNIMQKLEVKSSVEIVKFAIKNELIKL